LFLVPAKSSMSDNHDALHQPRLPARSSEGRLKLDAFCEKVAKVKADVAAKVDHLGATPTVSIGGMRKGGSGAIMAGGHNVG
jgi:hypothetical protein